MITVDGLIYFRGQTKIKFKHGDEVPTTPQCGCTGTCKPHHAIQQSMRYSNVPAATAECDQHRIYQVCLPMVLANAIKNSISFGFFLMS
jgi:hypothetical protein